MKCYHSKNIAIILLLLVLSKQYNVHPKVQQGVNHAEQQLQQLEKQQLQQQQNHHRRSNTSNHHSHQNALTQQHKSINHHNQIPTTPNPGTHYYHIEAVQPQIFEPSPEETIYQEELEHFANIFKKRRIELGFSQRAVCLAIYKLCGKKVPEIMIYRFEELQLPRKYVSNLKPLLQKWLEFADNSVTNPRSLTNPITTLKAIGRRRKYSKRTYKETSVRVALEKAFLENPKPTSEEISMLAERLAMEKKVVRVWSCNRKAKEKRINPLSTAIGGPTITESATSNMLASIAAMGSSTITASAPSNMFAPIAAMGSPTITESAPSDMFASIAAMGSPTIAESAFASIAAMGSPTITESAPSNMFASIAAMGSPTITESAPSDMFASIAAMRSPTITESATSNMLASIAAMGSSTITASAPSNMFAPIAAMGSPTITESAPSDMFAYIANSLGEN